MVSADWILSLKPVMFRYQKELDPRGIRQFDLVAENVEKVTPDLVADHEEGKPYSVRYEAAYAMLLAAQIQQVKAELAIARSVSNSVAGND